MGSPEFALPSLEALRRSRWNVVAVVTQPDRPRGRGGAIEPPPVKRAAVRAHLPVYQPEKVRDSQCVDTLSRLEADLIVVVAFGQILPPSLLRLPRRGCVNLHASLLPTYRGAAPINWAIINGEKETGVTTMLMDEGMDTGPILLQKKIAISEDDTAGSLSQRMAGEGAALLVETVSRLEKGGLTPVPQDSTRASSAPLLKKEDGEISWNKEAREISCLVRGTDPWPGAWTFYRGLLWKVWKTSVVDGKEQKETPGRIKDITKDGLLVETGKGVLRITEIQPANSRRMTPWNYHVGHSVTVGDILGS